MNEIKKPSPLLEAMNDIDDAFVAEAAPVERKRPKHFKPLMIAAAAAVLCGVTAVTAVANTKPPKAVAVNDKLVDVDYTVYTDEKGREIRTYAFELPDYALGEEKEDHTAVGKVRAVERDDDLWGGWDIVDEEGNVFHWGINNKKVIYDVIYPNEPRRNYQSEFGCSNFLFLEYDLYYFDEYYDNDLVPDKECMCIFRYGDKETARRLMEEHGYEFNEERFDSALERHYEELELYNQEQANS